MPGDVELAPGRDGPDDPAPARHGLGPHVVGQRIVVRRLVLGERGPSGGPAMTDVIGTCLRWADGTCVVQPEGRGPVTIPVDVIVSGKPVPPRPSPRLRISPADAQRRAMSLFPGLETQELGGWTLRHSPAHDARRANSVLAVAPSGLDPQAAHDAVVAFYADRGRRPVAAVLGGSAEEAVFAERGWGPESGDADTVFHLAGVAALRRARTGIEVDDDDIDIDVEVAGDVGTATHPGFGHEQVTGVGVVDGDWIGLRGIFVPPELRGRGLGRDVVSALLEWGASRGATTAYLQVLGDNAPALALYARLGFVEHHRYRYLAPPADR